MKPNPVIYLDYNSTTPVDKQVLDAMLPYFTEKCGNASSRTHRLGWTADEAVKKARTQVSDLINALEQEIIFTSGATEAINLGIKGVFESYASKGDHIVTVATEHKAVLDTCKGLENKGARVTYLPVDTAGSINLHELEKSITDKTVLVCAMFANNETGLIHPVKEIAEIVHRKKSLFFCDATQAVGKIPVDIIKHRIDLMSISAHKLYGPKGVGALFVRRKDPRVTLTGQQSGGGHERGLRSGTLNVTGIVGLGKACEIAQQEMNEDEKRISALRDLLEKELTASGNISVNGSVISRLPNTSNLTFKRIKADKLISKIPELAIATGSACTSALPEPSHVLKAMNVSDDAAYSSVRFSLGKFTTREEIEKTIELLRKALSKL